MSPSPARTLSRRARACVGLLGVFLLAGVVACDGSAGQEARSLAQAVERYRRAGNDEKAAFVGAITAARCSTPDVCAARDVCLASAQATTEALRRKVEVARAIGELEQGRLARDSAAAQALPAKLDEAEQLLREGFERLGVCDEQVLALKRTYRF